MLRPLTVTTVIDLPIAKRRYVKLAIDPSATRRLWTSTCGTLAFINRIRKPPWVSFSALSQRLIMTLLPHQLLRMHNLREHM